MPRFVILTHDHPFLHWDFLLEWGGVLRSWRLLELPRESPCAIFAEALPDHRRLYLDYEGPVSRNRGAVQRWDWGEYELLEDSPNGMRIRLSGQKVQGEAVLELHDQECRWVFP